MKTVVLSLVVLAVVPLAPLPVVATCAAGPLPSVGIVQIGASGTGIVLYSADSAGTLPEALYQESNGIYFEEGSAIDNLQRAESAHGGLIVDGCSTPNVVPDTLIV